MSTATQTELRVVVAPDRRRAELVIPPGLPRQALTVETCQALLRAQGVKLNPGVLRRLQEVVKAPPGGEGETRLVVAQATEARDGQDGKVLWSVDAEHARENAQGSYYDRSVFIMVKAGQVLGRIEAPTTGHDGVDVTGGTLAARAGKPVELKLDESILRDPSGQMIAQVDGALVRQGVRATIRKVLEVRDYVDFSTGNIDFPGDVKIGRGIRDLFVVKAGGCVEVGGLIESATIECGGDLISRAGIAGRGRGQLKVGGNLSARYLDNIQGEVRGDLICDREAINSNLVVHGAVKSPGGMILGGRLTIVGPAQLAVVGSAAGVATELILGSVPGLEPLAVDLEALVQELTARRDQLQKEQKLMLLSSRLTAQDRERQTEIMFELQILNQRLAKGQPALEGLMQRINQNRTVDLSVGRCLHNGAVVTVGKISYRINGDLPGPVRILREKGDVVYQLGSASGRLAQVAEVHTTA